MIWKLLDSWATMFRVMLRGFLGLLVSWNALIMNEAGMFIG
jgi:hypothetical protein